MQMDRLFVCTYISEMEMLALLLCQEASLQRTGSGKSHLCLVQGPPQASIIDTPFFGPTAVLQTSQELWVHEVST